MTRRSVLLLSPFLLSFISCLFLFQFAASDPVFCVETEFRIGVLYWSMNIPGQVAMRDGLEAQARNINSEAAISGKPAVTLIPMIAGDGAEGIERQISQMEKMVAMSPHLIIVQPTDNAALAGPLRLANKASIPVVAYDQYISGGTLTSYITSDNYQAGYLDGEYTAAHFPDDHKLKLILVEYPHVSSTVERVDGFIDALKENRQSFDIIGAYEAVEPAGGHRAGEAILRDFPVVGSIDAIFSVNDGGGLSVVDVLSRAGRREIFVATIDGDPKSIENIKTGNLTRIDSAQFCGLLGAEAMKASYALLTGEKIPRHILVPAFPITRETIDLYPGWLGPMPADFEKPWKSRDSLWRGAIINHDARLSPEINEKSSNTGVKHND
ncbi:MAG: sugar ABC transporter substrate-binding protein [Candidatus Wallbacteria bacterium HGW-Wallbacteria-1]|jgi:ribose transport system substrate-binding protein|uniref:Sugar ABC transporter substrate-binding protein n=1 Tax=Candidatus Wallbacteria bacterium HGW-Wallbacteria-1 TaxID=2013854 RepID=A0A2N1PM12_9BACT|nr:MAG: sugar ABC transporter substrate-binding protein [Candidatus Wallbacteria bacterium HGW-Wallbacteria-1]